MTDPPAFTATDIARLLELDPNSTYAPLPAMCAILGVPLQAQLKRIKAHELLRSGLKTMSVETDSNGMERQPCLRVDLVPLWVTGLDADSIAPEAQPTVASTQRQIASLLWQSFRPQGFGTDDTLLPDRWSQSTAEVAYAGALAVANLAREQMLLERQISADQERREHGEWTAELDVNAVLLARTVRRVAQTVGERSRRNEYPGIFDGLYRQWGITSYRRMPPARLREALEWLERWYGDVMGEPEPPPDI